MEYGLALLECFSSEFPTRGIADMAEMTGTARSTVHRYASTLVGIGLLQQDRSHKYRLAGKASDIGHGVLARVAAHADSWPILEELRAQTGHTASLAVMDGLRATYVQRAHGHRSGQYQADLDLRAGTHLPLHCTAIGKAMLASQPTQRQSELIADMRLIGLGPNTIINKRVLSEQLSAIGKKGLSICDEEYAPGVRSIAIAIPVETRRHTLAVEITVPANARTPTQLRRLFGPALRAAARRLSLNMRTRSW